MEGGLFIIKYPTKRSTTWMLATAVLGLILGLIMLFYPGGTMTLMKAGFRIFQAILTGIVLYFCLSEAIPSFKGGHRGRGVVFSLLALIAIILIWIVKVSLIFYVLAFFLTVLGVLELIGSMQVPQGKFFLALLGIVDILVAVIIISYPLILAYLVAWYVLFWGLSRLLLALEFRKALHE